MWNVLHSLCSPFLPNRNVLFLHFSMLYDLNSRKTPLPAHTILAKMNVTDANKWRKMCSEKNCWITCLHSVSSAHFLVYFMECFENRQIIIIGVEWINGTFLWMKVCYIHCKHMKCNLLHYFWLNYRVNKRWWSYKSF